MAFTAAFDSDCEECDAPVERGQQARMLDYDKGRVAHVVCPEAPPPLRAVCPSCFLIHAGECW